MLKDYDEERFLRYLDHVGKYVKVKTVDSCEHEGWLKCIDPLSGNFFLMTFDDDVKSVRETTLVMGDACSSLTVVKECDDKVKDFMENLTKNDINFDEDVSHRKKRLIAWIKKNRLPVVENEEQCLIVAGSVTVHPPYDTESCTGKNAVTLRNMRKMIAKLPPYLGQEEPEETSDTEAQAAISDRKKRLFAWIKKNRLPIIEDDRENLIVCYNVSISSPYDVDNCLSCNAEDLNKVRELIATLPDEMCEEEPNAITEDLRERVSHRKKRLIAWLTKNIFPVDEDEYECLTVAGTVRIYPPYIPDSCHSRHLSVLELVREAVEKLPPYVPKEKSKKTDK